MSAYESCSQTCEQTANKCYDGTPAGGPAPKVAVVVSLVHWLVSRPRLRAVTQDLRRSSQVTLAVTGVSAMLLFLLMGVIRTTARSDYTIYGQLKESNSYGVFQAPNKNYYP